MALVQCCDGFVFHFWQCHCHQSLGIFPNGALIGCEFKVRWEVVQGSSHVGAGRIGHSIQYLLELVFSVPLLRK